ncbi:MAG: hypothetical protein LBC78_02170 [Oscillospiraceae bacterium]|jgi:hypothetical protein|nr:hypothetical protein [Oscillospiraceae bacterium]
MKKLTALALVLILTLALFAGCKNNSNPETSPSATPSGDVPSSPDASAAPEIDDPSDTLLAQLVEEMNNYLGDASGPLLLDPVTADTAQNMLGLTAEQFSQYVTDASAASGALNTMPDEFALIRCNDADAAQAVKQLVRNGFDPGKWICVRPELAFVIESDSYVLLACSGLQNCIAVQNAFNSIFGEVNLGQIDVFFAGDATPTDLDGGGIVTAP